MMRRFTGWVCAALLAVGAHATAAEKGLKKDTYTFGTLQAPSAVSVRSDAANWLKDAGKYETKRAEFDAL